MFEILNQEVGSMGLPDDSFDALLCDPPYGISFCEADWDQDVPSPELFKDIYRVLKPGAFGLVYSGTKHFWKMGYSLSRAGFEIVDTIIWLYAQDFSKGRNVSKDLDKKAGKQRTNEPISELAKLYDGYNTALCPAYEPVFVIKKPTYESVFDIKKPARLSYADNVLRFGCGVLNIDEARIPTDDNLARVRNGKIYTGDSETHGKGKKYNENLEGRWPKIVIIDPDSAEQLNNENESNSKEPSGFFFCAKANKGGLNPGDNKHPTLKPIELNTYLAVLLKLPTDDSKILVPFCGAGSEVIGCLNAGWKNVVGVESDSSYAELSRRRVAAHLKDPFIK